MACIAAAVEKAWPAFNNHCIMASRTRNAGQEAAVRGEYPRMTDHIFVVL
jgi:hypothetical protein